jgi:hypothetical protein
LICFSHVNVRDDVKLVRPRMTVNLSVTTLFKVAARSEGVLSETFLKELSNNLPRFKDEDRPFDLIVERDL